MSVSNEQLKDEFVKLIDYLAKGSKNINGFNCTPKSSPVSIGTDSSPSSKDVSSLDFLSDKLERDLISLLGEYNINKRSKTNLDVLLRDLEYYFSKNNRIPFKHVNSLIKSIDTSKTNVESVLELLNLLKNNYLASTHGSVTPQFSPKSLKNKRDYKETFLESNDVNNTYNSDDLLSSQLRELYYSPLPVDEDRVETQSPLESIYDFDNENKGFRDYDIVMDMIYILKGMEPKYFKKVGENYFLTNSNVKLSKDMRYLTNRICTVAKMYHSIKGVDFNKNPIMDALFQAIVEELDGFNKLLDILFLNLGDEYISLLQLYSLLHSPYRKIRLIYNLVNVRKLSLQNVYDNTFRGDVMSRDLFTRLLRKSLVPFFEVVYKWLYLGELSHKNNYFFVSESGEDFRFDGSKVFGFFPMDLARSIFQKGRLSHYLKKLKKRTNTNLNTNINNAFNLDFNFNFNNKNSNNMSNNRDNNNNNNFSFNFTTFLEKVCGDYGWSLNESLRNLRKLVSDLNYSVDLASILKDDYELTNYFTALCCQFIYFNNDFKRYIKPSYDMSEAFEMNQMVFYPNRKFPYSLIIDNNYEFYRNMIKLSALFRVAIDKLNQVFSEYLCWNKYNKGVLELSPFFNKANFYRSEMLNFLFILQPFRDAKYHFELFIESINNNTYNNNKDGNSSKNNMSNINNKDNSNNSDKNKNTMSSSSSNNNNNNMNNYNLEYLRKCNINFLNNLFNKELFPEFINLLMNVIDFCNCLSDLYKQDMNRLHSSLDSTDPDDLVKLIDNELVDYSTSWSCLKSAELFRDNVLKILNKLGPYKSIVDFNDYYKFNYRLKKSIKQ